jgi:hypothetical protein
MKAYSSFFLAKNGFKVFGSAVGKKILIIPHEWSWIFPTTVITAGNSTEAKLGVT